MSRNQTHSDKSLFNDGDSTFGKVVKVVGVIHVGLMLMALFAGNSE